MIARGYSAIIVTFILVAFILAMGGLIYAFGKAMQDQAIEAGSERLHNVVYEDELEIIGVQFTGSQGLSKVFVRNHSKWPVYNISLFLNGKEVCSAFTAQKESILEIDESNCAALASEPLTDPASAVMKISSPNGRYEVQVHFLLNN